VAILPQRRDDKRDDYEILVADEDAPATLRRPRWAKLIVNLGPGRHPEVRSVLPGSQRLIACVPTLVRRSRRYRRSCFTCLIVGVRGDLLLAVLTRWSRPPPARISIPCGLP
jgi:hypothetical protein